MNDSNLESAWKLRLESEIEKLASENAALKAEEERLKLEKSYHWEGVDLHYQKALTIERQITSMLKNEWTQSLEVFSPIPGEDLTEYGQGAKEAIELMRESYNDALVREAEMRKGDVGN